MPTDKRPLKVFLCHAHIIPLWDADRDAVRALYTRLTNDGVDAWLDKEKLLPGQDWELEIKKAVREADVVVVCLSKQFNQAGFRQKEVRLALDTAMEKPVGEIFIIPARLEECDNLESLRKWHWVDLFEDDGYSKLAQALDLRAQQVNAYFAKSYDLKGELGNHVLIGQPAILSNLGIVHQQKGDFSKAIEYFESALILSQGMDDRKAEAAILSNLGSAYEIRGDLVRAAELYKHALQVNNEKKVQNSYSSREIELEGAGSSSLISKPLDLVLSILFPVMGIGLIIIEFAFLFNYLNVTQTTMLISISFLVIVSIFLIVGYTIDIVGATTFFKLFVRIASQIPLFSNMHKIISQTLKDE